MAKNMIDEIFPLIYATEIRDFYTQGHSEHVAFYSKGFASHIGLSKKECEDIYITGLLHDIGKIGIPDSILLKPGRLEKDEYDLIKLHSQISGKIVAKLPNFSYLESAVKYHHEDYNGRGYPEGLKGEEIPLYSRILSVADVFDALTTGRVYRSPNSIQDALNIMENMQKSEKFDPEIYKAFLDYIKKVGLYKADNRKKIEFKELDKKRNNFFFIENLTNLLNRGALLSLLRKSHDYKYTVSLLHFNLKNFKIYNQKYGLSKGDMLLKKVAENLKDSFNSITNLKEPEIGDIFLFRLHADKFIILYIGSKSEFLNYKLKRVGDDIYNTFKVECECSFILNSKKVMKNIEEEIGYLL